MKKILKYYDKYIGEKYNRLTVVSLNHEKVVNGRSYFIFNLKCDCGNLTTSELFNVKSGKKVSCGCKREGMNSSHKLSKTRIYNIWAKMKARCTKESEKSYDRYGGRGISVCTEWIDFVHFYNWSMANGYSKELSIDRINNDGNYEPSNCRWATTKVQASNTSRNVFIEHNGIRLTSAEWSLKLGSSYTLVSKRINQLGWDEIAAVTTPVLGHGYSLSNQKFKKDL